MRFLQATSDHVLDFIENTRTGARLFRLLRIGLFTLLVVVASRTAAGQFLSFSFEDVLFMASTAIVFLVVAWRWEIGIALIVASTSFIFHYSAIPTLSLYHFVPELTFLEPYRLILGQGIMLLLFVLYFTSPQVPTFRSRLATPLTNAILIFELAILCASVAGVVFQGVDPDMMVKNARGYSFYLLFFLILLGLKSRAELRRLFLVLQIMALIVAVGMMIQFFSGDRIRVFIGHARVETFGRFAGRVLPPGQALVWLSIPMLLAYLSSVRGRAKVAQIVALLILSAGLLLTFTRAMWMGTLAGILALLWLGRGAERRSVLRLFVAFAGSVAFLLLLLGTISTESENYMSAYIQRFVSTFQPESYEEQSSVGARILEIKAAWEQIVKHPWLGIGVGGTYRYEMSWDQPSHSFVWRGIQYIHNVYILILCNAGVLGLTTLLVMFGVFFARAVRILRRLRAPGDRGLVLGAIGSTVSCVIGSMLQPSLAHVASVGLLGIVFGTVELLRWFLDQDLARSQPQTHSGHRAP